MERAKKIKSKISLYFEKPGKISLKKEKAVPPGDGQVLVETRFSAISAGTEMLFYKGEAPGNIPVDSSFPDMRKNLSYPLKYGYSAVGKIIQSGKNISKKWIGSRVFGFNPHESFFCTNFSDLILLPEDLSYEDAVFLPAMETAVNLLHDASPLMGENVLIIGQGIIGIITAGILCGIPNILVTLDKNSTRRAVSSSFGTDLFLDTSKISHIKEIKKFIAGKGLYTGFDVILELSGDPEALDTAISLAVPGGRIIIGSWYGKKRYAPDLGSLFHRNRLSLIGSQVSNLSSKTLPCWTKIRRFDYCLKLLMKMKPSRLITHYFNIHEAKKAYALLADNDKEAMQIILTYEK